LLSFEAALIGFLSQAADGAYVRGGVRRVRGQVGKYAA
jgi:hypothetical protein